MSASRTKQLHCGFKIPVIGIGTYSFGGEEEPDISKDAEYLATIRSALDLGFRHIDTAESYGHGHTEELVGEAIEGRNRSDLFITSKVSKTHLRHDDLMAAAQASLRRLRTTYLDLYLIHAYNPDVPLEETMRALDELVDNGVVRNIGVCNFSVEHLIEAQKHARHKIMVDQMKFSVWTQVPPDTRTITYCQEHDVIVTAYKVLGRGRIDEDNATIDAIALNHRKTNAQIMINWAAAKPNIVVIFASTNMSHLKEDRDALDFTLDETDTHALDGLLHGTVLNTRFT